MKKPVDGMMADVLLCAMWSRLHQRAEKTFAHLERLELPAGMRGPWRALRAQLRRIAPDPPGERDPTGWQFAQISCGHLCQLSAAVGGMVCAAECFDTDTFRRCGGVVRCWKESNRMVAAFWDASREHTNAIDALFNTEATT